MWNVTAIKAKNFLSYEEVEIKIKNNETTLIYGKNLTDRGVASNGSGKSSILEMAHFCLTGNSLRKVKNKEMIRNGQEEATVIVTLENPVLSKTLRVSRVLHSKKPSSVSLYENGKLREDLQDLKPAETDKVILAHLEISASDLANYYFISKEKYQSLLLSNDTQKKEVINRFSKADYINPIFPQIDEDIKVQQNVVDGMTNSMTSCTSKIELLNEQIEELKNSEYEVEKQARINANRTLIEDKERAIEVCEAEIIGVRDSLKKEEKKKAEKEKEVEAISSPEEIEEEIQELKKKIKSKKQNFELENIKPTEDSLEELNQTISVAKKEIDELTKQRRESEATKSQLEKIILGEIECPKCSHTFLVGEKDLTLEETKEQLELQNKILGVIAEAIEEQEAVITGGKELEFELRAEIEGEMKKFEESVERMNEKLANLEGAKEVASSALHRNKLDVMTHEQMIKKFSGDLEAKIERRERLKKGIDEYKNNIKQIEGEENPIKKQIKELTNKIKEQEKELGEKEKELSGEKEGLDNLIEWKANFKRFKSFLANQSLSLIEQQANYFLNKMKCDNRVTIDGFRELSNGKLKEEISIEISRDGMETESFGKFSGGEKAKVDLSCILAMQTLINASCEGGGLNFLFCDEILESADEEAMNSIANSLKNVDKTVFIIAQSQPNVDCSTLEVRKENKISNIIYHG